MTGSKSARAREQEAHVEMTTSSTYNARLADTGDGVESGHLRRRLEVHNETAAMGDGEAVLAVIMRCETKDPGRVWNEERKIGPIYHISNYPSPAAINKFFIFLIFKLTWPHSPSIGSFY